MRRAYGARAGELIDDLAATMRAAQVEALLPRTEHTDAEPGTVSTAGKTLHDDLFALRSLILTTDVSEEDHDRDLHLRAALSEAIGAASSLAGSSSAQPTAAYLRVAKPAINGLLSAAGEPPLS